MGVRILRQRLFVDLLLLRLGARAHARFKPRPRSWARAVKPHDELGRLKGAQEIADVAVAARKSAEDDPRLAARVACADEDLALGALASLEALALEGALLHRLSKHAACVEVGVPCVVGDVLEQARNLGRGSGTVAESDDDGHLKVRRDEAADLSRRRARVDDAENAVARHCAHRGHRLRAEYLELAICGRRVAPVLDEARSARGVISLEVERHGRRAKAADECPVVIERAGKAADDKLGVAARHHGVAEHAQLQVDGKYLRLFHHRSRLGAQRRAAVHLAREDVDDVQEGVSKSARGALGVLGAPTRRRQDGSEEWALICATTSALAPNWTSRSLPANKLRATSSDEQRGKAQRKARRSYLCLERLELLHRLRKIAEDELVRDARPRQREKASSSRNIAAVGGT